MFVSTCQQVSSREIKTTMLIKLCFISKELFKGRRILTFDSLFIVKTYTRSGVSSLFLCKSKVYLDFIEFSNCETKEETQKRLWKKKKKSGLSNVRNRSKDENARLVKMTKILQLRDPFQSRPLTTPPSHSYKEFTRVITKRQKNVSANLMLNTGSSCAIKWLTIIQIELEFGNFG